VTRRYRTASHTGMVVRLPIGGRDVRAVAALRIAAGGAGIVTAA
jgi:hypothetical protein